MLLKCAVFSDNQLSKHQRKVSQKASLRFSVEPIYSTCTVQTYEQDQHSESTSNVSESVSKALSSWY